MILFILAGLLSGICVAVLAGGTDRRRDALVVLAVMPVLLLSVYVSQGHPDLAGAAVADAGTEPARFQVMRLAEKPVERLEQTGGHDAAALAILGELNERLGNHDGARAFYNRALAEAERGNDPRADIYRDMISRLPKAAKE